ncbi:hypothetical protein M9H77_22746 [Catharanthus roseus]|uniref:Uncharacterized protein n=1 Tax=Catharanthus roseus TaxID=4058 RepID=A0ACC0AU10_CATRO|nr:hypothetical protein M9H77_22746 [Catharanthus roseus]
MGEGSGGRGLGDLGSSYQFGFDATYKSHPPTSYAPPPPSLGFLSFQSPHPPGMGSSSFQAPLAPRTRSSSFQAPLAPRTRSSPPPYMIASSSYSDEHDDEPTNVVTPVQQLRFGHRGLGFRVFISGAESLDIANKPNDITCPTGKKNIEISRYGSKSLER